MVGNIKVWNCEKKAVVASLSVDGKIECMTYFKGDLYIATSIYSYNALTQTTIYRISCDTRKILEKYNMKHSNKISCMYIYQDHLYTTSYDNTIICWDTPSMNPLKTFTIKKGKNLFNIIFIIF